jgi:hypothetical protein
VLYQSVSSSCIAEVGYDSTEQILAVRFHRHQEYRYVGVPEQTYQALLSASSIGRYFNAEVRNAYPHVPATQSP